MNSSQSKSTPLSGLSNLLLPEFISNPDPEIYLYGKYLALDFEAFGPGYADAGDPESGIVLACWSHGGNDRGQLQSDGGKIHHQFGTEFEMERLRRAVEDVDFIVAHNSKYELKWLLRMGVELRRILPYCTQIGEYVRYGNRRIPLGLDQTAKRYGLGGKAGFVGACIKAGIDVREIPRDHLLRYCERDVELTRQLFLIQRDYLAENGQLKTAFARNIVTPALASMEFEGVQVDAQRVHDVSGRIFEEYGAASGKLDTITGGINFRSSKQVSEYLYGKLGFDELRDRKGNPIRTDTGKPRADAETIAGLKATTPEQKEFISAMREMGPLKTRQNIMKQLVKACKDDNGRVYATFNQTVTQTHRLSSTGGKYKLQFHNFPRDLKPLFRARDAGWVVCEADAPQLEFRVAVDLCDDRTGRADILGGVDVHQLTSTVMGLDRQQSKAYTFKPLYGGQSGTPRARAYYAAFREKYSGIYRTQQGWSANVLRDKSLRIPSGLTFFWPDTTVSKTGYISNTPSIFNYPIQSFATADIIPLTLVLVWHKLKSLRVHLVNTIHDSIIAEVHPEDLDEYKQVVIESFTKDIYWILDKVYGYKFTTPLGVGIKVGEHWGEGKEEKYEGHSTGAFG